MTYELNDTFIHPAIASSPLLDIQEPYYGYDVCVRGDDHREVEVSALRADQTVPHEAAKLQADVCAPAEAFAYSDDVTPQGVATMRDHAAASIAKKKWKVIDGYVGSADSRVASVPA